MKALLIAIKSKFDATAGVPTPVHNAAWLALGGRLYLSQAPQDATTPFCVYSMVSQTAGWTFSEAEETFRIQFSVWSQSASSVQVQDAAAAIQALFDDCALTVTGYNHVYMQREFSTLLREDLGEEIWWHHATDYNVMLEKSR